MVSSTPERRRRWREHFETYERIAASWARRGYDLPGPEFPPFPDDLRGLQCGARTRAGTPCKLTSLELNGRCKLHGGRSTGPRTKAGKEAARANLALRWRPEPREQ